MFLLLLFFPYSDTWPCGKASGDTPLCFQDIGGPNPSACKTSCTNTAHYESESTGTGNAIDTGKCTLKGCTSRTVNTTGDNVVDPCGPGECYYDQGNTVANSCSGTCANGGHYSTDGSINKTCLLKTCTARVANTRFATAVIVSVVIVVVVAVFLVVSVLCFYFIIFVYLFVYVFVCVFVCFCRCGCVCVCLFCFAVCVCLFC